MNQLTRNLNAPSGNRVYESGRVYERRNGELIAVSLTDTEAFSAWIADRRMWRTPERFIAAVNAHFDKVEAWHEKNGTIDQQIG